ncbi:NTP transferase domain-containing protein [Pedobacter sp. JCM 36344]|uniref:nucleotidyltransferase family protein n=1 Tax=Pedobacter sp. JCM 36344 TaxID=3374280 RepID=UPI00397B2C71
MVNGIIILAAGNSSRLGKPKQLLTYQGKTLLKHVTDESLEASDGAIVVVLGAYAEIAVEATNDRLFRVVNERWQSGMSSSLAMGLLELLTQHKDLENAIVTVSDQPYVTAELLKDLIKTQQQTGKGIVASSYAQTIGVPVLFNKKYFDLLLSLKGHEGAKKLLELYSSDLETVIFENGEVDIDTMADYLNLLNPENT